MIEASIVTIGDEILIGQVLDTNSQQLARALEEVGIHVVRMVSIGDKREEIAQTLLQELSRARIVFSTGGLGPTKDDITKAVLAQISGSKGYVKHEGQMQKVVEILHGRGLDVLPSNENQAMVPDRAHVIVNALGTAPIMVFRDMPGSGSTLYALPGVPHEAVGATALPRALSRRKSPPGKTPFRPICIWRTSRIPSPASGSASPCTAAPPEMKRSGWRTSSSA